MLFISKALLILAKHRGKRWVGSYRESEINPQTGKRIRRTVTFGSEVTSERAARSALQPYLDRVNIAAPPAPKKSGKRLCELIDEWKEKIIPNRKDGGARAALSHIRTYIAPQLGEIPLRELNLSLHQAFVTTVDRRAGRRKTVENVYGTLTSILNKGRKWGYLIPEVRREDIEFPADKKPQDKIFFFDADAAARIINAAHSRSSSCS